MAQHRLLSPLKYLSMITLIALLKRMNSPKSLMQCSIKKLCKRLMRTISKIRDLVIERDKSLNLNQMPRMKANKVIKALLFSSVSPLIQESRNLFLNLDSCQYQDYNDLKCYLNLLKL
jgi:hypothetical protein